MNLMSHYSQPQSQSLGQVALYKHMLAMKVKIPGYEAVTMLKLSRPVLEQYLIGRLPENPRYATWGSIKEERRDIYCLLSWSHKCNHTINSTNNLWKWYTENQNSKQYSICKKDSSQCVLLFGRQRIKGSLFILGKIYEGRVPKTRKIEFQMTME